MMRHDDFDEMLHISEYARPTFNIHQKLQIILIDLKGNQQVYRIDFMIYLLNQRSNKVT